MKFRMREVNISLCKHSVVWRHASRRCTGECHCICPGTARDCSIQSVMRQGRNYSRTLKSPSLSSILRLYFPLTHLHQTTIIFAFVRKINVHLVLRQLFTITFEHVIYGFLNIIYSIYHKKVHLFNVYMLFSIYMSIWKKLLSKAA